MCSTVGPRRTAVERFMTFVASPDAREALGEGAVAGAAAKTARALPATQPRRRGPTRPRRSLGGLAPTRSAGARTPSTCVTGMCIPRSLLGRSRCIQRDRRRGSVDRMISCDPAVVE